MRTLVLIPAYNEEKNLERVIENLKKKAPQFDYIIINDGSTDHTEKLCRKRHNCGMGSICRNTYKKWWTAWRKQTAML